MRYIIATTLLMTVTYISPASAGEYGCGPAVQNWKNGSQTTCTYDSNGGAVEFATATPAPPTPPAVEDGCEGYGYGEYGSFKSFKSLQGFKSYKGFKGFRGHNRNPS